MTASSEKSLYERLGGYDAICAATDDLITRIQSASTRRILEGAGQFNEEEGASADRRFSR